MNKDYQKSVSVIGLGQMGSKIASLFMQQHYRVTVWNRTKRKIPELEGAVFAESLQSAIMESDTVIICVYDNAAVLELLHPLMDNSPFKGKILINLTTGTPEEVTHLERLVTDTSAQYINGAIQVAPDQMARPDTTILLAGAKEGYDKVRAELSILGGNLQYLGHNAAASAAMDLATLSWLYGSYIGMLYGVGLVQRAGLDVNSYSELLSNLSPGFIPFFQHQVNSIRENNFQITQSPLSISISATQRIADAARSAGMVPAFHDTIAQLLKSAANAGLAESELSSLIHVIGRRDERA